MVQVGYIPWCRTLRDLHSLGALGPRLCNHAAPYTSVCNLSLVPRPCGGRKNVLVSIVCACVVAPRLVVVRICTCTLRVMLAVTLRAHSRIYSVARTKWRSAFLVSTKGLRWISLMLALQRVGKGHLTLKEEQISALRHVLHML